MATDVSIPGSGGEAVRPAGDPLRLLEASFEGFYATVHRYLLHRLFDRERAEELTAETFYRAATALGSMRSGREPGGPGLLGDARHMEMWLLRIATNVANTEYRRAKWRRLLFERLLRTAPTNRPAADEIDDSQAARVREVLRGLPPRHQAPLALRYYSQTSFAEMAVILECSEDAVRTRVSRALRELRSRLGIEQTSTTKTKHGDQ